MINHNLDDQTYTEILDFINDESKRIEYGQLYITLHLVEHKIIDVETSTNNRKRFNRRV